MITIKTKNMKVTNMTDKEFVEAIAKGNISDGEIVDYCKALDEERHLFLLKDLDLEILSYLCCCDVVFTDQIDDRGNTIIRGGGGSSRTPETERLRAAYNLICERFKIEQNEPQQERTEPQQMELKDLLPEELKADEAVRVFQKAIDARLITFSPEGLKWNDTKQLLAYFATKVSAKFSLTTRLDKDGNKTTAWKPFETLFNEQGLKGAKQNWMRLNTKFEPTGFEKVDSLF